MWLANLLRFEANFQGFYPFVLNVYRMPLLHSEYYKRDSKVYVKQ